MDNELIPSFSTISSTRVFIKEELINIFGKDSILKESSSIEILFSLYDKYFLNSFFKSKQHNISFSFSNRMTKCGGKTIVQKSSGGLIKKIEIRISKPLLISYKALSDKGEYKEVCGIKCMDYIDAFQLILEHELCHVIEFDNRGYSSCSGDYFKGISYKIFGHKSSYHNLTMKSQSQNSITKINKDNFKLGQLVEFYYKGENHKGIIRRINKRATVISTNNKGEQLKWYVPLTMLKIIDDNN